MSQQRYNLHPNSYLSTSQVHAGYPSYTPVQRKRLIFPTQALQSPNSLYSSQTMNNYRLMSPQQSKFSVRSNRTNNFPAVKISYSNPPQENQFQHNQQIQVNQIPLTNSQIGQSKYENLGNSNNLQEKMESTKSEIMKLSKKLETMKNQNFHLQPIKKSSSRQDSQDSNKDNLRSQSPPKIAISPLYIKDLSSSFHHNAKISSSSEDRYKFDDYSLKQERNIQSIKKTFQEGQQILKNKSFKSYDSRQQENIQPLDSYYSAQYKINHELNFNEQKKTLVSDYERLDKIRKQLDKDRWKLQMEKSEFNIKTVDYQLNRKQIQKINEGKAHVQQEIDSKKKQLAMINQELERKQKQLKRQTQKFTEIQDAIRLKKIESEIRNKQMIQQSERNNKMSEQNHILQAKKQELQDQQIKIQELKAKNEAQSAKIQERICNLLTKQEQFKVNLSGYEQKKSQMLKWESKIQILKQEEQKLKSQHQQYTDNIAKEKDSLKKYNEELVNQQQNFISQIQSYEQQIYKIRNLIGEQQKKYDEIKQNTINLQGQFSTKKQTCQKQINILKQQTRQLVQEIQLLKTTKSELYIQKQNQLVTVQQLTHETTEKNNKLKQEIQAITQNIHNSKEQSQTLQKECEQWKQNITALQKQHKQKIDQYKNEYQSKLQEIQEEQKVFQNLLLSKNQLNDQIVKQKSRLEKNMKISEIRIQADQAIANLQAIKSQHRHFQTQINAIMEQKQKFQLNYQDQRQKLQDQINSLVKVKDQHAQLIQKQRISFDKLTTQHKQISEELVFLKNQANKLKQEKCQVEQWLKNNEILQSPQIEKLSSAVNESKSIQKKLQEENFKLGQGISCLNRELHQVSQENQALKQQLNLSKSAQSTLRNESSSMKIQLAVLADKLSKLKQTEDKTKQIEILQKQNTQKTNRISILQSEINKKSSEISVLKSNITKHSEQIKISMQSSDRIYKQFSKLQQRYKNLQNSLQKEQNQKNNILHLFDDSLTNFWNHLTTIHKANQQDYSLLTKYREQLRKHRIKLPLLGDEKSWVQIMLSLLTDNVIDKLRLSNTEDTQKIINATNQILMKLGQQAKT